MKASTILDAALTGAAVVMILALTIGVARSETVTSVTDGDTFRIGDERVRIRTIDTPEISRPRCREERGLAIQAKQALAAMVEGRQVEVIRHGRDGFGRTLADVRVGGRDVGAALIERGLALPWAPGKDARARRVAAWCGGGAR